MKKYLSLSLRYLKLSTMSRMAYKSDFIAWTLVTLGWVIFTFIFYELLFSNVSSIAGWHKGQIYVLQGFVFLSEFVIWGFFYYSLKNLPDRIAQGQIDKDIVKPLNTQYALSFQGIGIQHVTSLIVGLVTIRYGLSLDHIATSLGQIVLTSLLFILIGTMLYSLYFLSICLTFWFDKISNIVYLVPNSMDFAKVPINAYSGISRIVLTYVVPITLASSLPSQILFGQANWKLIIYLLVFTTLCLKAGNIVLRQGLKRYSSASS